MALFEQKEELLIITWTDARLDAASAPRFKAGLQDNMVGQPQQVIVDLGAVEFMDSTGLGTIVSLMKMMGKDGVLAIAGAGPAVRRLLQITRLDQIFRLFDSRDEAEAALRG